MTTITLGVSADLDNGAACEWLERHLDGGSVELEVVGIDPPGRHVEAFRMLTTCAWRLRRHFRGRRIPLRLIASDDSALSRAGRDLLVIGVGRGQGADAARIAEAAHSPVVIAERDGTGTVRRAGRAVTGEIAAILGVEVEP